MVKSTSGTTTSTKTKKKPAAKKPVMTLPVRVGFSFINVSAPATTTTNSTKVTVSCRCTGTMSPVTITLTDQPPTGPATAAVDVTPSGFTCGTTFAVKTPTVGHFYIVTASMTCDGISFSDQAIIERL
jgi:hypothetical protein